MAKATFSILSESDKKLVLETEPAKLEKLDEDDLLALHARVRRARNKHTKLYRQAAAGRVRANKARANASKTHARDRARAEVLEEALARVSRRLGIVAHQTAEELKATRLATARAGKGSAKRSGKTASKGKPSGSSSAKPKAKTPATKKAQASTKASGKRRQAKRDKR